MRIWTSPLHFSSTKVLGVPPQYISRRTIFDSEKHFSVSVGNHWDDPPSTSLFCMSEWGDEGRLDNDPEGIRFGWTFDPSLSSITTSVIYSRRVPFPLYFFLSPISVLFISYKSCEKRIVGFMEPLGRFTHYLFAPKPHSIWTQRKNKDRDGSTNRYSFNMSVEVQY